VRKLLGWWVWWAKKKCPFFCFLANCGDL
jgi:hypothetical protein